MSLTSLCLMAGKPPVLQSMLDTELLSPQLQRDGELWIRQPYLSEKLSLNAAFDKVKPCSSMGRAVS